MKKKSFVSDFIPPTGFQLRQTKNLLPFSPIYFNRPFDKSRLKVLLKWALVRFGEKGAVDLVETLKTVGYFSATQAGISLSIEDLDIPTGKGDVLSSAETKLEYAEQQMVKGYLTSVEYLAQVIDTWNFANDVIKNQVIQNFRSKDILNPVYMMAFSGARGNISQVRQLVGMRGLMSDPSGRIIEYPIQSNFREGLTLTEYVISCYGARKGVVDTALRTATSGYLTRRLVDVAQHVIIRSHDCYTKKGVYLSALIENEQTIFPLKDRLVGRVLAEPIYASKPPYSLIAERNDEITDQNVGRLVRHKKTVLVRSPLACLDKNYVCQLCYGWSLATNRLVSRGETVGIIAAQSIGEPGTQLTMRTFHTGGVFSGEVSEQITTPLAGRIQFPKSIPGKCVRTGYGEVAFLTKKPGYVSIYGYPTSPPLEAIGHTPMKNSSHLTATLSLIDQSKKGQEKKKTDKNVHTLFLKPYTLVFVKQGQPVLKDQVLAETSSLSKLSEKARTFQMVHSTLSGEIRFRKGSTILPLRHFAEPQLPQISGQTGEFWILSAQKQSILKPINVFFKPGDAVEFKSLIFFYSLFGQQSATQTSIFHQPVQAFQTDSLMYPCISKPFQIYWKTKGLDALRCYVQKTQKTENQYRVLPQIETLLSFSTSLSTYRWLPSLKQPTKSPLKQKQTKQKKKQQQEFLPELQSQDSNHKKKTQQQKQLSLFFTGFRYQPLKHFVHKTYWWPSGGIKTKKSLPELACPRLADSTNSPLFNPDHVLPFKTNHFTFTLLNHKPWINHNKLCSKLVYGWLLKIRLKRFPAPPLPLLLKPLPKTAFYSETTLRNLDISLGDESYKSVFAKFTSLKWLNKCLKEKSKTNARARLNKKPLRWETNSLPVNILCEFIWTRFRSHLNYDLIWKEMTIWNPTTISSLHEITSSLLPLQKTSHVSQQTFQQFARVPGAKTPSGLSAIFPSKSKTVPLQSLLPLALSQTKQNMHIESLLDRDTIRQEQTAQVFQLQGFQNPKGRYLSTWLSRLIHQTRVSLQKMKQKDLDNNPTRKNPKGAALRPKGSERPKRAAVRPKGSERRSLSLCFDKGKKAISPRLKKLKRPFYTDRLVLFLGLIGVKHKMNESLILPWFTLDWLGGLQIVPDKNVNQNPKGAAFFDPKKAAVRPFGSERQETNQQDIEKLGNLFSCFYAFFQLYLKQVSLGQYALNQCHEVQAFYHLPSLPISKFHLGSLAWNEERSQIQTETNRFSKSKIGSSTSDFSFLFHLGTSCDQRVSLAVKEKDITTNSEVETLETHKDLFYFLKGKFEKINKQNRVQLKSVATQESPYWMPINDDFFKTKKRNIKKVHETVFKIKWTEWVGLKQPKKIECYQSTSLSLIFCLTSIGLSNSKQTHKFNKKGRKMYTDSISKARFRFDILKGVAEFLPYSVYTYQYDSLPKFQSKTRLYNRLNQILKHDLHVYCYDCYKQTGAYEKGKSGKKQKSLTTSPLSGPRGPRVKSFDQRQKKMTQKYIECDRFNVFNIMTRFFKHWRTLTIDHPLTIATSQSKLINGSFMALPLSFCDQLQTVYSFFTPKYLSVFYQNHNHIRLLKLKPNSHHSILLIYFKYWLNYLSCSTILNSSSLMGLQCRLVSMQNGFSSFLFHQNQQGLFKPIIKRSKQRMAKEKNNYLFVPLSVLVNSKLNKHRGMKLYQQAAFFGPKPYAKNRNRWGISQILVDIRQSKKYKTPSVKTKAITKSPNGGHRLQLQRKKDRVNKQRYLNGQIKQINQLVDTSYLLNPSFLRSNWLCFSSGNLRHANQVPLENGFNEYFMNSLSQRPFFFPEFTFQPKDDVWSSELGPQKEAPKGFHLNSKDRPLLFPVQQPIQLINTHPVFIAHTSSFLIDYVESNIFKDISPTAFLALSNKNAYYQIQQTIHRLFLFYAHKIQLVVSSTFSSLSLKEQDSNKKQSFSNSLGLFKTQDQLNRQTIHKYFRFLFFKRAKLPLILTKEKPLSTQGYERFIHIDPKTIYVSPFSRYLPTLLVTGMGCQSKTWKQSTQGNLVLASLSTNRFKFIYKNSVRCSILYPVATSVLANERGHSLMNFQPPAKHHAPVNVLSYVQNKEKSYIQNTSSQNYLGVYMPQLTSIFWPNKATKHVDRKVHFVPLLLPKRQKDQGAQASLNKAAGTPWSTKWTKKAKTKTQKNKPNKAKPKNKSKGKVKNQLKGKKKRQLHTSPLCGPRAKSLTKKTTRSLQRFFKIVQMYFLPQKKFKKFKSLSTLYLKNKGNPMKTMTKNEKSLTNKISTPMSNGNEKRKTFLLKPWDLKHGKQKINSSPFFLTFHIDYPNDFWFNIPRRCPNHCFSLVSKHRQYQTTSDNLTLDYQETPIEKSNQAASRHLKLKSFSSFDKKLFNPSFPGVKKNFAQINTRFETKKGFSSTTGEILNVTQPTIEKRSLAIIRSNPLYAPYPLKPFSGFSYLTDRDLVTYKIPDKNEVSTEPQKQRNWKQKVGEFIAVDENVMEDYVLDRPGQIVYVTKNSFTLRHAQCFIIAAGSICNVRQGDFLSFGSPVLKVMYSNIETEDIIQGIPKIDQLFEARSRRGFANLHTLLREHHQSLYTKMAPQEAALQSFGYIQKYIIEAIQSVYKSQGVNIADKHIEVIVKQMTAKIRILDGLETGLLSGDTVYINWFEKVRSQVAFQNVEIEPMLLGITQASLQVDGFVSAASFQETVKILTQASILHKTDFLKGLKENIIVGHVLPAGTGIDITQDPSQNMLHRSKSPKRKRKRKRKNKKSYG